MNQKDHSTISALKQSLYTLNNNVGLTTSSKDQTNALKHSKVNSHKTVLLWENEY
jgi:hypothetical protein